MNARERFFQTMQFGSPDRVPYWFGHPRQSTLEAWYLQGLPRGLAIEKFVGMDKGEGLGVNLQAYPRFEERILEEDATHKIWIDDMGAKRVDHKRPPTPGFETRRWLEFPVKNREDFRRIQTRFNPDSPERYPADWAARVERWKERDYPVNIAFPSMFWKVREWVGFEGLCMMVLDDPMLVHEMMEFVAEFTMAALDRALRAVKLDYVYFNEDMAYKTASMISPAMVREFMMPRYLKLVRFLRERGVGVLIMDCDGYNGQLIPLWLEAGISAISPVEIAANNDPVLYRKKFGKSLSMVGGIDKRELRFDKARVKREVMSRVPWLVEQGGYIPTVDHGVPPDIPVRNYLYMVELIKQIATGRQGEPACELEEQLGPIEEMWTPDKALAVPDTGDEDAS